MKKIWLIGFIFVQLKLQLIIADSFVIQKERNEKSHTGILLFISADGTTGTVCRETTASSDITPSKETADTICTVVKTSENNQFHRAEWVDSARYLFDWAQDLPILLADLRLVCDKNGACQFKVTPSFTCKTNPTNKAYHTTTISCGCDAGYYRTEEGCFKCGNNTYTQDNNTSCTPCPAGTSTVGSQNATGPEHCVLICLPDQVKISGRCVGNMTIALICGVVAVLAAVVLLLWCAYRKYQAMVQRKVKKKRSNQAKAKSKQRQSRHSRGLVSDSDPSSSVQTDRANFLVTESDVSGSQEAKLVVKMRPDEKKRVIYVPEKIDEKGETAQKLQASEQELQGSTDARDSRQELHVQAPHASHASQDPTPLQVSTPMSDSPAPRVLNPEKTEKTATSG